MSLLLLLLLSCFSRVRLCDPIDGSPPGSPVPGILQARTLEWVAISFSNAIQSKSFLPFLEGWEMEEKKFEASNHGLVFLVTIPYPEPIEYPTKNGLIRTKVVPITQGIPRNLGVLCQEPGAET